MRINTNMSALNAWRNLTNNGAAQTKALEKLSSGSRINRAADDAAGLAVSEKMRAQIRGTNMAIRNSQDGISMVQTAEGALTETHAILQRMRELTTQSQTGTLNTEDQTAITSEITSLQSEINRIAENTKFNGKNLLSSSVSDIDVQVGSESGQTLTVDLAAMGTTALTLTSFTASDATALTTLDTAIGAVSTQRAKLGATQNRLEHTVASLQVTSENLSAAESRIRDVDMASEMANFTKYQILTQASTAMLSQANQSTQGVLSLLR